MRSIETDLDQAEYALENDENFDRAFALTRPHAKAGHARAQFLFGKLTLLQFTLDHYGVDLDPNSESFRDYFRKEEQTHREVFSWLAQSAEQGYAAAQEALGIAYAEGRGVSPDPILGHMWFFLSAAGDEEETESIRASAERNYHLSEDEIKEAERMAAAWRSKQK